MHPPRTPSSRHRRRRHGKGFQFLTAAGIIGEDAGLCSHEEKDAKISETYVRTRDDSFFYGMRRGEAAVVKKDSAFDFQEKLEMKNIHRSASDIGDRRSQNNTFTVTEDVTYSPKNSPSDIVLVPIGRSLSGRWSKTSSPLVIPSDLNINFHDLNEPSTDFNSEIQRSYSVSKGQTGIPDVPLPPSAALFYNGASPQMEVVESCESVRKLNMYLKARRDYVNSGIPGKFLHAVIGPDVADVGSVASTIMYAFYLDETLKNNQFCTVPVINMKRANLDSRADLLWLLDSCHIDLSSLIFVDEIDLSYYDLFGSLKLVLLNCDKIPSEQESDTYSWVDSITVRQDLSCCTVIAEKIAMTSPEILAGQGFSRLLLAGILLDTGNLSSSQCTSKDKYMATLLINGAGRFGCNGLYQILKYKTYGPSDLKVEEILRKEFKKWTTSGKPNTISAKLRAPNIGMSSIGMSVAQLLSHDSSSIQEIIHFQKLEKIGLLLVVSGYYDTQKKFKREILVSAESSELMKNLLLFLNSSASQLPLKVLHQLGLKDGMRVFEIDKVISRRTIERLLEEFISASN
ncbi:hypothetical protein DH2020_017699 [Rehmannia glutinosa]|uniref:DHHA2 domain-containing protein n=1 Tax=Rehmannia glutinosa TaxID=99300 RepID=A0ABR0WSQ5_REHGL